MSEVFRKFYVPLKESKDKTELRKLFLLSIVKPVKN